MHKGSEDRALAFERSREQIVREQTKGAVFIITAALHYMTVTLHMTVTLRVTLSIL